ncbi:MAG: cupin domain-containing protein [Kiritimatiellia bacterium]|jgi:quercetin dioxygenase-like cupin family protein|nr:cupin domain-containing protein [Kiritimatiellia bacterium]MDP6847166.1 cupin domain-containing protein [Kiritimatiellia bacterium]
MNERQTAMTDDYKGQPLELATTIEYSAGSVVSKTLLNKKAGTLTLFAFDAGQGLSEHTSPYDATVMILDGEAELVIGGEIVAARTGELVIMPANVPHDVRAKERFKMLLIMIREKTS